MERAARLDRAWHEAERAGHASQKEMASLWGVHHSNVSQYINGHIPLNVEAQLQFARYLRRSPLDIWPDFEFGDLLANPAESLQLLSEDDRAVVRALIASLQKKRA